MSYLPVKAAGRCQSGMPLTQLIIASPNTQTSAAPPAEVGRVEVGDGSASLDGC